VIKSVIASRRQISVLQKTLKNAKRLVNRHTEKFRKEASKRHMQPIMRNLNKRFKLSCLFSLIKNR